MGQVIALHLFKPSYPDSVRDLGKPECVLLLAVRWWVDSYKRGEDPLPRIRQGLLFANTHDAVFSIDALMGIIARTGQRPIDIRCPRCPALAPDESILLQATDLVQIDRPDLAECVLRTTLLSADGASFAVGPLEGIARMFAGAGLLLRSHAGDTRGMEQTRVLH